MGKLFSKIFQLLKFPRREKKDSFDRTRSQYPVPVTNLDDLSSSISSSQTPEEPIACGISAILLTCQNNQVDEVKKISYHGNLEIIQWLPENEENRSIQNTFQCLAFNEASTDEINALFLRISNDNRLVMDIRPIQSVENVTLERDTCKTMYNNTSGTTLIGKDNTREQDSKWIAKTYTTETDFHNQNQQKFMMALLSYHPSLDNLLYINISYHALSSATEEEITFWFLYRQEFEHEDEGVNPRFNKQVKRIESWIMCKYMPYTVLNVNDKQTLITGSSIGQYLETS